MVYLQRIEAEKMFLLHNLTETYQLFLSKTSNRGVQRNNSVFLPDDVYQKT
jgi:hypothetical protein